MKKYHEYAFLSLMLLISCDKNQEYPCKAMNETTADFTVMEDYSFIPEIDKMWKYYACDTVGNLSVRFTAKDSLADLYEWHIGSSIYNNRKVILNFPASLWGKSIPVTLILTKRPNLSCFPKDNGIDTLIKRIHFIDPCKKSLIQGKFFGHNENTPKDTFSVDFNICKFNLDPHNSWEQGSYVSNLYPGCSIFVFDSGNIIGYKEMFFSSRGSICGSLGINGIARISSSNNQITVDYSYYADLTFNKLVKNKFIGIKVSK